MSGCLRPDQTVPPGFWLGRTPGVICLGPSAHDSFGLGLAPLSCRCCWRHTSVTSCVTGTAPRQVCVTATLRLRRCAGRLVTHIFMLTCFGCHDAHAGCIVNGIFASP
jgi:hypothetical protein